MQTAGLFSYGRTLVSLAMKQNNNLQWSQYKNRQIADGSWALNVISAFFPPSCPIGYHVRGNYDCIHNWDLPFKSDRVTVKSQYFICVNLSTQACSIVTGYLPASPAKFIQLIYRSIFSVFWKYFVYLIYLNSGSTPHVHLSYLTFDSINRQVSQSNKMCLFASPLELHHGLPSRDPVGAQCSCSEHRH